MQAKQILKNLLKNSMDKDTPIFSHDFMKLVKWGQVHFNTTFNADTYSRKFRELKASGEIEVKQFKHGRENGYHILSIKE